MTSILKYKLYKHSKFVPNYKRFSMNITLKLSFKRYHSHAYLPLMSITNTNISP